MNFNTYQSMLTCDGLTERDRSLNQLHRDIDSLVSGTLSFKDVLINGIKRKVTINSTLDTTIKSVIALPGEPLCVGNHVKYNNHNYYMTECSCDDGIYAYGKMEECTDIVRFISAYDGSIVEYPVILQNATKFNTGETPNKRLTIPSGQFTMVIPIDNHTLLIDNGFRFLIDRRTDYPSAYKVTYVDCSTYGYDDGLLNIVLLQCSYDPDVDSAELMIADYYTKYQENPSVKDNGILFDYVSPSIKVGGTGTTFVPTIVNDDVSLPLQFIVDTIPEIQSHLHITTGESSITFIADNVPAMIGSYVKLLITDADGENKIEVLIRLKGLI